MYLTLKIKYFLFTVHWFRCISCGCHRSVCWSFCYGQVLATIRGSVHWQAKVICWGISFSFFFAAIKFFCDMNYMGESEGKNSKSRTIKQMRCQLRIVYKFEFYNKLRMMEERTSWETVEPQLLSGPQ